jgi:peptidoglycan/LPS O-acetylase OafA/YrhL
MKVGFPLPIGWQMLFGLLCAGTIVLCTSAKPHRINPGSHLLEKSGDASFSTYLFHPIILTLLSAAWDRSAALHDAPLLFILVAVIASNIMGYLVHLSVERPVVRWMGRKALGPRTDAAKGRPAAPTSAVSVLVVGGGDDPSPFAASEPNSAAGTL